MAIKTNLKSLVPRRQAQKREITLLSHGYTDRKAWPSGKLIVYPWDNAVDQWLVDNVRKISKQEMVYGLLKICCDLNGGAIDDFIADEINVVLLVSRALATDGVVVYTPSCPHCGFKKSEQLKVPDELEKIGEKADDYAGFDTVTLPHDLDVVTLRPLTVKDEKTISNRKDEDRAAVADSELRTMMRVITVNDSKADTLAEMVQWFRALHTTDAKFLEEQGRLITPHLNSNIPHVCDDCHKAFKYPLNFDTEFFR